MSSIAIVGYGNVGKNLHGELGWNVVAVIDPFVDGCLERGEERYDLAFVAVDTPLVDGYRLDTSTVDAALDEVDADVICIKSTVPVGYTRQVAERFEAEGRDCEVCFSPEYYGTTQHANNFEFDFTVLGGSDSACHKAIQALQDAYDARHRFITVGYEEAEVAKVMENAWLATKVDFCLGFKEICDNVGIRYERVRECFISDPRVNPAHTFVYDEHPFWSSHCLDKDVPYAAYHLGNEQLRSVVERNEARKAIHKR